MLRKSSDGRRPSLSGAPLRVRQDNRQSHGSRPSSLERASSVSSKLPVSKKHSIAPSSQQHRPRESSAGRGNLLDYRKSVAMSRSSTVFKSGRPSSGIGVRGRTDVPKDSRPISDRRFQSQCISTLLEFLTSHKYPHPISQKLLASPSNKDFFTMFEFIMCNFWDDYKPKLKMQEEVPSVLKLIGYPYNVPKTYLCSVGSPHTWPHLMASLIWMIELLQIQSSMACHIDRLMFEFTEDDFDSIPDDKISFDYREKTFNAFMAGADTFEAENQALEKALMEKYHGGDINDILEENKRLEALMDDSEKMEERISALREFCKNEKQDGQRFREYLEQMKKHTMALAEEYEKHKEEMAILKSDIEKEEARLISLQIAYEHQELKPGDVERLKAERERLQAQVDHLERQMAVISADNLKMNMEQAKLNERLESEVANYNRQAIKLKIVPESAEYAEGKDFRLRTGCASDVVMDFHNNIKPKLALMKRQLSEQFRCSKKEQFRLVCDTEKMQEVLSDKRDGLVQKERELKQLEEEIEMLKKTSSSEHKSASEQLRRLEQEVTELSSKLAQAKVERDRLKKEYADELKQFSVVKAKAEEKIAKMRTWKQMGKDMVKAHIQDAMKRMREVLQIVEAADVEAARRLASALDASHKRREKFGLPHLQQ